MEKYLHALNLVPGMSYHILNKLWSFFGDWGYVWERSGARELVSVGIGENLAHGICLARKEVDADRAQEELFENDVAALERGHPEFPSSLLNIPDPPFLLYRKGAALDDTKKHVAIVGTRGSSSYGEKITHELSRALARSGAVVVSGLAYGIDAKAHQACIEEKRPTVAVLASGVLKVMPGGHTDLSRRILERGGTLLSEYPNELGFHKARYHERNRLISGLSCATLVMEADFRSGALITARRALEQGRDVYALPGDLTRSQSRGCLALIADGAYPILSVPDTIAKLGLPKQAALQLSFTPEEKRLLDLLHHCPLSTERLLGKSSLPPRELSALLSRLEIQGAIMKNKALQWEVAIL